MRSGRPRVGRAVVTGERWWRRRGDHFLQGSQVPVEGGAPGRGQPHRGGRRTGRWSSRDPARLPSMIWRSVRIKTGPPRPMARPPAVRFRPGRKRPSAGHGRLLANTSPGLAEIFFAIPPSQTTRQEDSWPQRPCRAGAQGGCSFVACSGHSALYQRGAGEPR